MTVLGTKSDAAVASGIDTLQASLATIIQKATTGVEAGVNFLSAQMPDVIHQLLMWKLAESIFTVLCCIIVTILWLYGLKRVGQEKAWDTWGIPWVMIGMLTTAAATLLFYLNILTILQIWIAPKIYLIEYAAKLIGGK